MSLIINFEAVDVRSPQPWPVRIDARGLVTSGLGDDDGACLVGFGPAGEQRVTYFADEELNLEELVGMQPTFVDPAGKMFLWRLTIASVEVK